MIWLLKILKNLVSIMKNCYNSGKISGLESAHKNFKKSDFEIIDLGYNPINPMVHGLESIGLSKSPWIIHYDGSSCNGCDIEVLAALTPLYDVERFGIINTGNPKHADIFLFFVQIFFRRKGRVFRELFERK